ncbi:MAG TPA: hypothetical protein VLZ89_16065 [Anaerolineales bacterium]|nr:hypothetical protein [Anaerolineales bacterium]
MYLRIYQFNLAAGQRSAAEAFVDNILPAIRMQNGCDRCEFFLDDESGDCGFIVLWSSKEAADATAPTVFSILTPVLAFAAAPPTVRFFEVYEPKKR